MHLYLQRKLPPAKTLVLSRKEEEESCFCGSLILARHLSMGCLMRFDVGTNARRVIEMLIRVKSISCVDDIHHKGGAAAGTFSSKRARHNAILGKETQHVHT
eukprot:scaffold2715_cov160-Chaetoceros_neogracile.AAC.1